MSDEEQKKIFSENLLKYLSETDRSTIGIEPSVHYGRIFGNLCSYKVSFPTIGSSVTRLFINTRFTLQQPKNPLIRGGNFVLICSLLLG